MNITIIDAKEKLEAKGQNYEVFKKMLTDYFGAEYTESED